MAKPKKPSPFDVKLSDHDRGQLAEDLCRAIEDAFSARQSIIGDGGLIDLMDWFYEQGQSTPDSRPFPGAADLTSYFVVENVDALHARLMTAVYGVRPFCYVEGRGADAKKAGYVEEFMDWQVRKSDLKFELARTVHGAELEDCYILEVSEKIETRRLTEEFDAAIELSDDGTPLFADGRPKLKVGPDGEFVKAQPGQAAAHISTTRTKTKRLGPQYDSISMKDFVFLPGHAKGPKHVWGYAYRIFATVADLLEQALDGVYDEQAVKDLGESSERETEPITSAVDSVAAQYGPAEVEKELMQVSLKRDLDGDGRSEWYVATVSLKTRSLLRLKLDTFAQRVGRSRCVPFVLCPRRNSVYGYGYANKLLTLAEEHTALRNMKADRSALKTNAPIMQVQGGIWDSDAQPIGIGRVITVRDRNELDFMKIEDVPPSIVEQERALHMAKERVGGLSDGAGIGVTSTERRTATENRIVAAGSGVRVKEMIGYLHTSIAEVLLLSHAIWVDTLKAEGSQGLEAPDSVVKSLESRGLEFDGKFTAEMLEGDFAFEPYGSDDTADPEYQRAMFDRGFGSLTAMAKAVPGVQPVLADPEVGKTLIEQWCRVNDVRDRGPFVRAFNKGLTAVAAPPVNAGMGPAPMGEPAGGGAPDLEAMAAALGSGNGAGAGGY